MNKPALKRFATEARRELLERVELQARKIGITSEGIQKATIESSDAIFINGRQLKEKEKAQRNKLISRIREIGFDRVMEEVAYTWFNRFTALRFMEINDYLPTKVRVLSSTKQGSTEPDMMNEALTLDLDLDKEYVYELKLNNNDEELFKYLVIKHCNDLNRYMPFMFETIDHYTEILFPEGLLGSDSFVREMTNLEILPEETWQKVEVIGWLYQYYIAEENERVIQAKKRYKAEELPFATQLFTPEWIVRYMVQNALGRYWIESHPEDYDLMKNWDFYLENRNIGSTFEENLDPYINKELKVEEITCFDPAMGSGHILVYMFDVLYEIYSKAGYMDREIPRLIIENNLYGLDIDDRSYQLASFSVVMKALEYNKRFLRSIERDGLTMNLAAIQETNTIKGEEIKFLAGESSGENFEKMNKFIEQFHHAKVIGSLIKVESFDEDWLNQRRMKVIKEYSSNLFEMDMKDRLTPLFNNLIKQAGIMSQKHDIFITNPPYAGNKYVTAEVSTYLVDNYPKVKADLFSAFIEYSFQATKSTGQIGLITPFVWMFISTFEGIRKKIVEEKNISSLVQLEYNGFEAAMVPVCVFTMRNYQVKVAGEYIKLSNFKGIENQSIKTLEAIENSKVSYRYLFYQENFSEIPGNPIAYWVSEKIINNFSHGFRLGDKYLAKRGLETGDNKRFLKYWFEVSKEKIYFNESKLIAPMKNKKWFPYNKGGGYRRWYGLNDLIVDFENDGEEIKKTGVLNGYKDYLKEGITWSALTSSRNSFRYSEPGFLFDSNKGPMMFPEKKDLWLLLGLLNSNAIQIFLNILNPTLSVQNGDINNLPYSLNEKLDNETRERIITLVKENVQITKNDWDSLESSWNFKKHPLMQYKNSVLIETVFETWIKVTEMRFNQLKLNEEEINKIITDLYELQEDLHPEIEEKYISIKKADLERDIKSFILYAVGCYFGRYSLDEEGLVYAGGNLDLSHYKTFAIDQDNIVPILEGTFFEDNIVTKFIEFVQLTFGEESLEENLVFIANSIGRKKNETARETLHRYFLNDFYKDYVQVYKKRPIYWLFTSGKEKAFSCLIYMHRYDKTTLSRIRTDYLHEVQTRMDTEKKDLLNIVNGDSTTKEISNAKKELKSLDKKIDELKAYDEKLHHMADMQIEIDLDDGVAVNYAKFEGLVAKI
ncbi:MAG: BREX-1 system adenine-specific DNA-methyltransferase PglX [Bacillota bacterium]